MSRFLAKIAVEAMVQRLLEKPEFIKEFMNDEQLYPIRKWARYGSGSKLWPFHERRIYERDKLYGEDGGGHQVLHEYDFLFTPQDELYFCVAFFGKEFTINMGGDEIEGYLTWLADNDEKSPLYT